MTESLTPPPWLNAPPVPEYPYEETHDLRTGPDLHRVGGRYSDEWHRIHLINPRDVVPESIMPGYPWLAETPVDASDIRQRLSVLRTLGVPYTDEDIKNAPDQLKGKTEMDAIIAYLQNLGTTIPAVR